MDDIRKKEEAKAKENEKRRWSSRMQQEMAKSYSANN